METRGKGFIMSFESMTVVFNKGDDFHTLELDTGHTANGVDAVLDRLESVGWEIVSVVVYDEAGPTETVNSDQSAPIAWQVAELFTELDAYRHACERAVAFLVLFGWNEWNEDKYSERCFGEYDNEEDFAENYIEIYYKTLYDEIPPILEIDWAETARNIETEENYSFIHHNGSLFAFRNE